MIAYLYIIAACQGVVCSALPVGLGPLLSSDVQLLLQQPHKLMCLCV